MFHLTGVLLSGLSDKLAYLDPGSGSILIQILLAALLGVGVLVRASWGRIRGWFGVKPEVDEDAEDEESSE